MTDKTTRRITRLVRQHVAVVEGENMMRGPSNLRNDGLRQKAVLVDAMATS